MKAQILCVAITGVALFGCSQLRPLSLPPLDDSPVFLVTPGTVPGCDPQGPRHISYDLAVLELSADGLHDTSKVQAIKNCIQKTSEKNKEGTIVVIFIHGWTHSARWDDAHFAKFREILSRLTYREAERWDEERQEYVGRRVFGVYVGWPGGKKTDLFLPSYRRAKRIGRSQDLSGVLTGLTQASRESSAGESVVLWIGHSLGAMMLETSLSGLLDDLVVQSPQNPVRSSRSECKSIAGLNRPELLPDLVLLLGPATEARQTRETMKKLIGVKRIVSCIESSYVAPLVVYITSEKDTATGFWFWIARRGRKTAGNTEDMVAYDFKLVASSPNKDGYLCARKGEIDFGQSWHCLRRPQIVDGEVRTIKIDLPRAKDSLDECHRRYAATLNPELIGRENHPFWVVRVPDDIVDGHSDIFNERSAALILAMSQMGGSIMSLAPDIENTFEDDQGQCSFRPDPKLDGR